MVQLENGHLAADRVSISNSIESLRLADTVAWREFVEVSSGVEQTLWGDPAGVYPDMDFRTRDRYRVLVQRMATRRGRRAGLLHSHPVAGHPAR